MVLTAGCLEHSVPAEQGLQRGDALPCWKQSLARIFLQGTITARVSTSKLGLPPLFSQEKMNFSADK